MSKNLFQYLVRRISGRIEEGKICLFNLHTNSVEQIAEFSTCLDPYQVATTKDKVDYFICHCQLCKFQIFAIRSFNKSFEIFDLNTRQISRGLFNKSINDKFKEFTGPDPPEWRQYASVAYYRDKLYYLGGISPKTYIRNQIDVRRVE